MKRAACVASTVLVFGFLGLLAGCDSMPIGGSSWPDDAMKANQQAQMRARVPTAAEIPPGLGEDLPMMAGTQPAAPEAAMTQPTAQND